MTPEMLGEQIEGLKEMGFGGFHMHSRAGMAMPYLKEDFMNLVKFCTKKAKDEGMLAYLYDEDKWPSGFAGGYVTKNPRFRQRSLVFSMDLREHFSRGEAIDEGKPYLLAVYDIVLNDKGELEEYRRISKAIPQEVKKAICVYCYCKREPVVHNNQTYVDTLDKEAIDEFIDITYEAYERAVEVSSERQFHRFLQMNLSSTLSALSVLQAAQTMRLFRGHFVFRKI